MNTLKTPSKAALNYVVNNDTQYLHGDERRFYQSSLERKFTEYDFSYLNDIQLMDIYDADEVDQMETLNQYYE